MKHARRSLAAVSIAVLMMLSCKGPELVSGSGTVSVTNSSRWEIVSLIADGNEVSGAIAPHSRADVQIEHGDGIAVYALMPGAFAPSLVGTFSITTGKHQQLGIQVLDYDSGGHAIIVTWFVAE